MKKAEIKKANMEDLASYQRQLWKEPRLTYVFFELTDRCNLNCIHCGSRCESTNNTFLYVVAVEKTLGEIAARYNPSKVLVCITGGEPLLHPAVFEIIKTAHEMGFPVGMTTNGTLIDRTKAQYLLASGIKTISVSLDGMEDEHDRFRRCKGCFQKAIQGIGNLKSVGLEPEVITVVHKNNLNQLEELYDFLCDQEIYAWRLVSMDPIGRAIEEQEQLLDGAGLRMLLEFVRSKRYDNNCDMLVNYGCSHFLSYEYENEVRDYYFQCLAGTKTASIRANGDMVACLDIKPLPELVQGNVYTDNFVEIWETNYQVFRNDRTENSNNCRECGYRNVCMGDATHTWDFELNEPMYCASKMMEERV